MRLAEVSELGVTLDRVAMWLRRQMPQAVSGSTITTLDRLAADGPSRVSELAVREGMTQPGATLLVNRLTEAGYAERVADPTDRRAVLVRITGRGRALLADRNAARAQVLRARLADLSDEDQQAIMAALPALARVVSGPTHTAPEKGTPAS